MSETQKLALCGQLVGMLKFCTDFEEVSCISLQNGKFKIEQFGRFVLAMGTDRNIQESLLNHRAELMKRILRLYHNDINTIFEQFDDCKKFSDKLYHIFETYLPVLQYNSNPLQNIYKLYLPKSASNLFLDATQVIENVASKQNVLGGMILYNNKVISSQFSKDLTKVLVATDPLRIKTTADIAKNVNFHMPVGCQIIKIYIPDSEYEKLLKRIKKVADATSLGVQNTLPLPFSIKKKSKDLSIMKREKSLIFTNIPEEEALIEIPSPMEKSTINRTNRPNHLPLKLKTIPPESGIVSFDESDSYPDFIGKTSIASTPMTENKILAGPIQSIFAHTFEDSQPLDELKVIEMKPFNNVEKKDREIPKEWENVYISFAHNPFVQNKKKSFDDLKVLVHCEFQKSYKVYNTITDPLFPIFNDKKLPISKILFDEFELLLHPNPDKKLQKSREQVNQFSVTNGPQRKFDVDPMIMKRPTDIKNSPNRIVRNQKKKMLKLPIKSFSLDLFDSGGGKPSTSKTAAGGEISMTSNATSIFDSPSTKTKKSQMGGLQLTPLMSKLTLLAMNENENFSTPSFDLPTPNYVMDTPSDNTNRTLFNRLSKVDEEKHDEHFNNSNEEQHYSNEMRRVDLLVIGQQNMTMMVIAEEDFCDHVMVQQTFEICVNRLSRLEQKLNEVINVSVDLKASEYSFLTIDNQWNVLQRSGTYDQQTTLLIYDIFTTKKSTSDIIIRTNESLVYGHNSGDSQVFYQHPTKQQTGFLAPSEFTIISQAKRKLERDQSILLF